MRGSNATYTREEWAQRLIGENFYIFPLQPGKKIPFSGISWKATKSRDPSVVREWFRKIPDMNYAVVCDDEHVIIDVDNGMNTKNGTLKEGEKNFREAEDTDAGFPASSALDMTFKVRSPKGGYHLYFKCDRPYRISASQIIPDVDVRTRDGYVVGPGCHTDDFPEENTAKGTYEVVLDVPMAHVPLWLKKRLDSAGASQERASNASAFLGPTDSPGNIDRAQEFLKNCPPAIEGRGGDDYTVKYVAMGVRDFAISEDKCLELMLEWNDGCLPPWNYEELKTKVHNAYCYAKSPAGRKADLLAGIGDPDAEPQTATAADAVTQAGGAESGSYRIRSSLLTGAEFLARDIEVDSLISEWVPASGITAILAKRGVGKTAVMLDMSLRVSCDMPWNGVPTAQGWACLYLCGEDDIGLQRQMAAWKIANNAFPVADRFIVATAVPNLMNGREVELWIAELKSRFGGRRVAVYLDTWQRATKSASQNEDKDMQLAVHHAEALARALNGCSVIAFHSPKENEDTITGSMVQENSTTAILCIKNIKDSAGTKSMKVARIKGRGEGNSAEFRLREVPLELRDKSGAELTGVVAEFQQDAMTVAQREMAAKNALETDRQRWARIIRTLLERTRSPLSTNALLKALKTAGDALGDVRRPSGEVFRRKLSQMFATPVQFEDGVLLSYVKTTSRMFEFQLSSSGIVGDPADVSVCFPNASAKNAETKAFPASSSA